MSPYGCMMMKPNAPSRRSNIVLLRAASFILVILHWLLLYLLNVHVYVTHSRLVLHIIIVLNIAVVTQWYLLGGCVMTPIENWLTRGATRRVATTTTTTAWEDHVLIRGLSRVTGLGVRPINVALSLLPLLSTCVAVYRLHRSSSPFNDGIVKGFTQDHR